MGSMPVISRRSATVSAHDASNAYELADPKILELRLRALTFLLPVAASTDIKARLAIQKR